MHKHQHTNIYFKQIKIKKTHISLASRPTKNDLRMNGVKKKSINFDY